MIEQELFEYLVAEVPSVDGRVYAVVAPQSPARPYIVTSKVASTRIYSHDGDSELTRELFQISCYHTGYESIKDTVEEVIDAMEDWEFRSFMVSETDTYEQDVGLFHVMLDYHVWHKL